MEQQTRPPRQKRQMKKQQKKATKEAEETDEEAAEKAAVRKDESENPVTPTERQRLKDEFDIHVEALWSTITCDVKDTLMVEKGLPSQEMERHFGLLREMCKTLHTLYTHCVYMCFQLCFPGRYFT